MGTVLVVLVTQLINSRNLEASLQFADSLAPELTNDPYSLEKLRPLLP